MPLTAYGIPLPAIRILANCVEDTVLDRATLTELTQIIDQKAYPFAESISLSLLKTAVPKLEIFKNGHAQGQPVHRLEYRTQRKHRQPQSLCIILFQSCFRNGKPVLMMC